MPEKHDQWQTLVICTKITNFQINNNISRPTKWMSGQSRNKNNDLDRTTYLAFNWLGYSICVHGTA